MKNFDLKTYGVSEMTTHECVQTEGGFWGFIVAIAVALATDVLLNPSDAAAKFCEGIGDGLALMR